MSISSQLKTTTIKKGGIIMGYTNYWTQKKAFTKSQWNIIKKEYDYIKENFVNVLIEDQTEKPDEIVFNGLQKNDLDHETFYISKNFREPHYKNDNVGFNFCKTARKPYDLAVWHLLTFIKMIAPDSIELNRDGWNYWRVNNE